MKYRSRRSQIRFILLTFIIILVCGYGLFEARGLIIGPKLTLISPQSGESVSAELITIQGTVLRARELHMNGFPITWNEQGVFKETTLVAPGRNIFTFEVTDKFGRKKATILEIYRLKSE